MAGRIPDINVIQDTPTSPNHVPRPIYTSPELPRVPEDGLAAPELDRDTEGLQVDPNGSYPYPTTKEIDSKSKHYHWVPTPGKQLSYDDAGLIPYEDATRRKRERICGLKRRTFFIVAAIVAIVIVAAAVGGGVGGYYANKSSSPTSEDDSNPVTSGNTGMAALPCAPATVTTPGAPQATPRGIKNPFLARGATFDITCRRGVPNTGDKNGHAIKDIARFTEYNITSCMDRCAVDTLCKGIVYSANLTEMVADGDPGGNCLLKNATWEPTEKRETWWASALKEGS